MHEQLEEAHLYCRNWKRAKKSSTRLTQGVPVMHHLRRNVRHQPR